MSLLELKFFDGETNPDGESNSLTTGNEPTNGEPSPASTGAEPTVTENEGDEQFNVRSELFNSGSLDGEEYTEPTDTGTNGDPQTEPLPTTGEENNAQTEPQQPEQPYRTLKYHGQDIGVKDENELLGLAQQGLDYTQKMQTIAPYRKLVEKMETDPFLKQQIVSLVLNGALPNTPAQTTAPAPQTNTPKQTSEPEPQWQDGESYDEYRSRYNAWKNGGGRTQPTETETPQQPTYVPPQSEAEFYERVNAALRANAEMQARVDLLEKLKGDVHGRAVYDYMDKQLPPALKEAADKDLASFKMVYDQVRQGMFGETYFVGAQRNAPIQTQTPTINQQQVQIKQNGSKTPFVERSNGQTIPTSKNNSGLPSDIWNMSEKDFDSLVDRVRERR